MGGYGEKPVPGKKVRNRQGTKIVINGSILTALQTDIIRASLVAGAEVLTRGDPESKSPEVTSRLQSILTLVNKMKDS